MYSDPWVPCNLLILFYSFQMSTIKDLQDLPSQEQIPNGIKGKVIKMDDKGYISIADPTGSAKVSIKDLAQVRTL